MKTTSRHGLAILLVIAGTTPAESDDHDQGRISIEGMAASAFGGNVRVKLSGLADFEAWSLPQSAPGLVFTNDPALFNPRLRLFLDGQIGSQIYFFAQARFDRGFDPGEGEARAGLDEYAIRVTPWEDGRFSLQVGKFSTVVGNWTQRHLSWDNPFINAPLPYENLTGIWDQYAADSAGTLLAWAHVPTKSYSNFGDGYSDKSLRVPVIWGPAYTSGASVAGRIGDIEYAAEIKNAALSSRPESWDVTAVGFQHPTVSGRIGYRPNMAWNFGVSASSGTYLLPEAQSSLPPGKDIGDFQQQVIGQDISFAWHHLQLWSEIYAARFDVPTVGYVGTVAYYLEAKYKFTPQIFGALRWNQQVFNKISYEGDEIPWGRDIWRIDAALGYRFTENMQLKIQSSFQNERWAGSGLDHMFAGQFTVKF